MITARQANRPDEDICLLLTFDNHKGVYACDCGTASNLTPKECGDTKALFITHTHIDHFINFDTFIRHQIGSKFHTIICGPLGLAKSVWAKLQAYNWNLIQDDPEGKMIYEVREFLDNHQYCQTIISSPKWEMGEPTIINEEHIYKNEKFFVEATPLDHKIPSLGYRFQEFDTVSIDISSSPYLGGRWVNDLKKAYLEGNEETLIEINGETIRASSLFNLLSTNTGYSVGFIMDHAGTSENHEKIATHFHTVDELYIESFYAHEEAEVALGNAHSTAKLSGKAAALAEAKKAVPLHFSRKYNEKQQRELKDEFFASYESTKDTI